MTNRHDGQSLEERAALDAASLKAGANKVVESFQRSGLFANGVDSKYLQHAHWMVYCELRAEAILEKIDFNEIIGNKLDRQELTHELILHFEATTIGFWNMCILTETHLFPEKDAQPTAMVRPSPVFHFNTFLSAVALLRQSPDAGAVRAWRQVWVALMETLRYSIDIGMQVQ